MIPKLIHQIWLGDKPMHPLMLRWKKQWEDLHQTWSVVLWSEANGVARLRSEWQGGTVVTPSHEQMELLSKACHYSQRSNIWRYLLMMWFGGLYVDTDIEPFKPIDNLIDGLDAFAAIRRSYATMYECAFFGAIPHHPVLQHLVDKLPSCSPEVSLSMGADYFTKVVSQHPEVAILSTEAVIFEVPKNWDQAHEEAKVPDVGPTREPIPERAFAKHHWSSLWFKEGFKPLGQI